jgi:dTDP-4-amino-4,6-dideoxygalactose transaminase
MQNIPISKPNLGEREIAAVSEVIRGGMIAQGPKVAEFEARFAEMLGVKHAIATNNGTTALTVALMAHDLGSEDEVIVPSFSFFATASSVLASGAKPVFADIDPHSFNLDPQAAEAVITPKTRAIMPVHLYGQPADMPAFESLCKKHGLILLEDAAQAHSACIGDRQVGSWGTGAFSFYPTKNMTSSEGGMVTTNDDAIAANARMVRNHGMNQQYLHERMGFNYRMTDIMAAIGLVQMDQLAGWTEKRRANAAFYDANLKGVITPHVADGYQHVFHQYTVRVPDGQRDRVMQDIQQKGIGARVYYPMPIHQQPVFAKMGLYDDVHLPQTERAVAEVMSLPIHPLLTDEERAYIVQTVNESVK